METKISLNKRLAPTNSFWQLLNPSVPVSLGFSIATFFFGFFFFLRLSISFDFSFHIYPTTTAGQNCRTVNIAAQLITPPSSQHYHSVPQHRVPYGKTTTSNSRHIKHPQFITIKKEKRGYILPILPLILVSSRCRATLVLHVPPCLSVYTSRIKYILYGCRDGSHRYTKVRIFRRKRWQRIEKRRKSQ